MQKKEKNIEKLPIEFIGTGDMKGYHFRQIKENELGYIYEVSDGVTLFYEIIRKILSQKLITFNPRVYSLTDYKEIYPKSNAWGVNGFTTRDYDRALMHLDKFNETPVSCHQATTF